jgi:hypothetical protein
VEPGSQLVGRQLAPGTPSSLTEHDDTGGAEHGDHAGDTEELGPPHDHVR